MFASNTSAANGAATYIEDVFSTYLYTGNGSTQTITNGIDLAGKGGLVWQRVRNAAAAHRLVDTDRGINKVLYTNLTNAQATSANTVTAISSTGFTAGTDVNGATDLTASWTFRKQPKFFDVVTYTGNGSNPRALSHNLGSVPGAIIVKRTDSTSNWGAWIRKDSTTVASYLSVNSTAASGGNDTLANCATSTTFQVDKLRDEAGGGFNLSGATYVAYLFAHDAGGFGLTGTDNVISCGSYTGNGSSSGPTITLGYEPQWLMIKNATAAGFGWSIYDTMRGLDVGPGARWLQANTANSEVARGLDVGINSTGFQLLDYNNSVNGSGNTYIYIAIRRGPMKTPTSGTSVFAPTFASSSGTYTATAGFPVDLNFYGNKSNNDKWFWFDRLRGNPYLQSNTTGAEAASVGKFDSNSVFYLSGVSGDYSSFINYSFRRAPGFFDEVCYTGTGADITVNHNLTVTPELIIGKGRSVGGYNWLVYHKDIGSTGGYPNYLKLNDTTGTSSGASTIWGTPTSTTFSYGSNATLNTSGGTYVAYLFASCPGVSKVGSFTMSASTFNVDCGFTAGARFILLKNTTNALGWLVWDSARGIVSGNDPMLILNSTAAEDATYGAADWIDPYAAGFTVNGSLFTSGTYIYLAIA